MNEPENTCMRYVPTFREKLGWKLFPAKMPEHPTEHSHKKYRDALIVKGTVMLSFVDRVRLLISGRLAVDVRTITENVIGENTTASTAYVLPPEILTRSEA